MTAKRVFLQFHKWLGLVAAIQIGLWMASGLVMSWFPIEEVRGEHNIRASARAAIDTHGLVTLGALDTGPFVQATLRLMADIPVFEVKGVDEDVTIYDARTGERLSPLGEEAARRIALADFAGQGSIARAELVTDPEIEYRGKVPVWLFVFDDSEGTHLYVSPETGRVVARRNDVWRLYDFFWMLHIMDYSEREDFNHPTVIAFAALGLAVALTGGGLLWWSVLRPQLFRRRMRVADATRD